MDGQATSSEEVQSLKQENAKLRRAVDELSFLNDLARSIGSSLNTETIMQSIIKRSLRAVKAEQGVITLVRDTADKGETFVRTMESQLDRPAFRLDKSLLGWMHINKTPLAVNDPRQDPRFRGVQWDVSVRSLACVPLLIKSQVTGVLTVYNSSSEAGFKEEDLRLLAIIASQSAQMIENARLAEEERELFRTKERLRVQLHKAYLDTIHRLVMASEYKDKETGAHLKRMSRYSALLASKVGMEEEEVQYVLYAAPMHDVGKIGIPDAILLKADKLTDEEFDVIKSHTTIGGQILSGGDSEILRFARQIAISHHEKWDGTGYPDGLKGEDIPIVGRIAALADVFDALTTNRPYKEAFGIDKACRIIREDRGKHFDPVLVDLFLDNINQFVEIKEEVDREHPASGYTLLRERERL